MVTAANILLGLCALFAVLNWGSIVVAVRTKTSTSFAPPFLCGLIGAAVLAFHPNDSLHPYFWVALVLDPSILAIVPALMNKNRRTPKAANDPDA